MTFQKSPFESSVIEAAKVHAREQYPREACGLVIASQYVPKENLAADPTKGFEMAEDTWLNSGPIQGVLHSHTLAKGGINVSKEDMAGHLATLVPWGVCLTDGSACTDHIWLDDNNINAPLIGRPFIPGIFDCYSAGMAYYWQTLGIRLKDYPRDDSWWEHGENMLLDFFLDAGFKEVNKEDVKVGDAILNQLGSSKINHCAIVLEGNLIYHHLTKRPSRREVMGGWLRQARKVIRYAA